MLLPRLAAMSEVQWLQPEAKNYQQFEQRLVNLQRIYRAEGYTYCRKHE